MDGCGDSMCTLTSLADRTSLPTNSICSKIERHTGMQHVQAPLICRRHLALENKMGVAGVLTMRMRRHTLKMASEKRYDLFKGVKPYLGDPFLGDGKNSQVSSLYLLSIRTVLREDVPYEGYVPTTVQGKLDSYKRCLHWEGPKIMLCSMCGKFYTTQKKFDKHSCGKNPNYS